MKLSVVIPAYNEEKLILDTLQKIKAFLEPKGLAYEILVVDDGSTDQTAFLVANLPEIKLIRLGKNLGKGVAVKKGMLAANGDLKLFMDADNSTGIAELDNFLPYLDQHYQIVIASRALPNSQVAPQSWWKALAGKAGNRLIQWLAVPGIKDTQCGFKLFTKEASELFKKQTVKGFSFDFEILFLARKLNYKIKEAPVSWVNRPDSRVKLKDYFKTLGDLIKIRVNDINKKYA